MRTRNAASDAERQTVSRLALNALSDGAGMRRLSVGIAVLAALSLASALAAALLDQHLTRWAATHPFLFALAGALLAVPLTALITALVVDALLSAHERTRADQVYQARMVRLGLVANTTLNAFARAFLEPGTTVPDGFALAALLAAGLQHDQGQDPSAEPGTRGPLRDAPDITELRRASAIYAMLADRVERIADADPEQRWTVLADDLQIIASSQPVVVARWEDAIGEAEGPSQHDWQLMVGACFAAVGQAAYAAEQFNLPRWSWPDPSASAPTG
jgi:hypothetical protein